MDDAVKLCSGNTVNPVTVMFSEGFFLRYCAFCKSLLLLFFILFFICQTKIFMVILTILCNFILLYCILFF